MSDFPHLDPEARAVVFSSPRERKQFIDASGYVSWPLADTVLAELIRLAETLPGVDPQFVMIRGGPLTGKQAILLEAHRLLAASYPLERRSVSYRTTTSGTPSQFIRQLMIAGEVPHIWSGRADSLRDKVVRAFQRENVRILLADNLHSATPTHRAASAFLPLWRSFCEETSIHGAFTTVKHPKEFLQKDPELAARTTEFELKRWPAAEWVKDVVAAAIRRYPLRRGTVFDWQFMEVLYGLTAGDAGRVFSRLKEAAKLAIDTGEELLTRELLQKARTPGKSSP